MRLVLVKRLLLGAPMPLAQARHERLNTTVALAVFASDPLSAVAYATEEILLVLRLGGTAALSYSLPVAVGIAALLAVVVVSYRQTVAAYPQGGGAYLVAKDNIGQYPALIAAAALLVDYVLTVSVSVVAGIAALTSAVAWLHPYRIVLSVLAVIGIALGNLRGVRESGRLFAAPTYFFVASILATVSYGLVGAIFDWLPEAPYEPHPPGLEGLGLFLLLRSYAAGCTALTGVEAVSNGVMILSGFAILLIVAFQGDTHALLPLYAIGVFISFTLSQGGMVRRWLRLREKGWRWRVWINGVGALVTGVVLLTLTVTKFVEGAWIVVVVIPVLVAMFVVMHRHYAEVARELSLEGLEGPPKFQHTVQVLIGDVHRGVVRAVQYARTLAPTAVVRAVYVETDPTRTARLEDKSGKWGLGVPLVVLTSPYRSLLRPLLDYLDQIQSRGDEQMVTIVLPEFLPRHWWQHVLHNQTALLVKGALLFRRNTVVADVPYLLKR